MSESPPPLRSWEKFGDIWRLQQWPIGLFLQALVSVFLGLFEKSDSHSAGFYFSFLYFIFLRWSMTLWLGDGRVSQNSVFWGIKQTWRYIGGVHTDPDLEAESGFEQDDWVEPSSAPAMKREKGRKKSGDISEIAALKREWKKKKTDCWPSESLSACRLGVGSGRVRLNTSTTHLAFVL